VNNCDELLNQLLEPDRLTAVVDIGANPIDGDPPYHEMLRKGLCTVTGFEPQPDALASLLQRKGPLGGWCSTGVYGGGRDPLGGRERFNGWSPLSILLLAVGFEGCGELLVAVGGCLGPCRRPWGSHRWVNSG